MPTNPSTVEILLRQPNTVYVKPLTFLDIKYTINMLEQAKQAIARGEYVSAYDINRDGWLNAADLVLIQQAFYGKWDLWATQNRIDIRMLVHIKKLIANNTYEADYDLDNNGEVSENDLTICRSWLLIGNPTLE